MGLTGREREVAEALVETKAVDFEAIGQVLARYGPTLALEVDFEEGFCGTMRHLVWMWRRPPGLGSGGPPEVIGQMVAAEIEQE
jgi:hypothetical protein